MTQICLFWFKINLRQLKQRKNNFFINKWKKNEWNVFGNVHSERTYEYRAGVFFYEVKLKVKNILSKATCPLLKLKHSRTYLPKIVFLLYMKRYQQNFTLQETLENFRQIPEKTGKIILRENCTRRNILSQIYCQELRRSNMWHLCIEINFQSRSRKVRTTFCITFYSALKDLDQHVHSKWKFTKSTCLYH